MPELPHEGETRRGNTGAGSSRKLLAQLKVTLAREIIKCLDRQGLSVREAHARTGFAAADFSRIRGLDLDRFTVDRLLSIIDRLGDRVEVAVTVERGKETGPAHPLIAQNRRAIVALCRRFAVRRLSLFGSILGADFDPTRSDIDISVEFARSRKHSPASQYFEFKAALERLLDRPVDLVELAALANTRLKRIIGRTQVLVYGKAA
jgi:predicted nucleotidyltransferase/predicted XRE-type DNA-binding protein